MANIAEIPNLLPFEIRRCQIFQIGAEYRAISEQALNVEEAMYIWVNPKHLPGVLGNQIFSRGWQLKIAMKKKMV